MIFKWHKQLTSPPTLLMRSLKFFKQHIRTLLLVGLVAEIVNIILGVAVVDNDIVKALWFSLFVGPAILLAIKHADKNKRKQSIKKIYYDAGIFSLPFLLTLLVLSIFTIPFSLGALVFSIAQVSFAVSTVEQVVLLLVWAVFATPTIVLITRYIFAQIEVVANGAKPAAAIAKSGEITRGKFKPVAVNLLWIGILSLIAFALVVLATNALGETLAVIAMESALYLVIVPIGYIYLYLLHKELS